MAQAIQSNPTWSEQHVQANGARRRALLIGTGWTLVVAVTLDHFKTFPYEPIYLWALGLVALGWAAALLHALRVGQGVGVGGASPAANDFENCVVVGGMARAIAAEMQRAGSELERVDELLAHAIEQLVAAFERLSARVGRQQEECAPSAAAAQDVYSAVTALQFRDVVGQKLGHVRRELETLERVMHQIRDASAAQFAPAAAPALPALAARVQRLLRELEQARAASPAQQQLMHAGEVDLF